MSDNEGTTPTPPEEPSSDAQPPAEPGSTPEPAESAAPDGRPGTHTSARARRRPGAGNRMDPTTAARSGRAGHQHSVGRVRLPGQHDDRAGRGPEPVVGHPVRGPHDPRHPRHPAGDRAVASRSPRGVVNAVQLDPDPRQRAAGGVRLHVHRRLPATRHAGRWLRPADDGQIPAVRARGRAHDRPRPSTRRRSRTGCGASRSSG